jgi:hypothetical protein
MDTTLFVPYSQAQVLLAASIRMLGGSFLIAILFVWISVRSVQVLSDVDFRRLVLDFSRKADGFALVILGISIAYAQVTVFGAALLGLPVGRLVDYPYVETAKLSFGVANIFATASASIALGVSLIVVANRRQRLYIEWQEGSILRTVNRLKWSDFTIMGAISVAVYWLEGQLGGTLQ